MRKGKQGGLAYQGLGLEDMRGVENSMGMCNFIINAAVDKFVCIAFSIAGYCHFRDMGFGS